MHLFRNCSSSIVLCVVVAVVDGFFQLVKFIRLILVDESVVPIIMAL